MEKKRIHLRLQELRELAVYTDFDALQEILRNLVENAIKYSPPGQEVFVTATIAGRNEPREDNLAKAEMVAVSVMDLGVCVPVEKQRVIFDPSERVTQEKGQREEGLGLGLHITKKLVEAQGGTIWIMSKKHDGTTFTFALPRG